ncbi:hypothetical protein [Rhizobium indigoferae]|uniref:NlpC/P60 domain-containing protein n=1 Tax=Rhizobium indigoferae TaxID=158891 RepID=A0ABZ0ZF70_9HYPH|nr:hypothetical protein [Rhizobium indigoferae]NNU56128.1 hypothetical protein [Rhizobium indigoferae]WQN37751.1 hypothetical protein U5G49_002890 [Rhizobium indigoferae]GLR59349.1 hypothetical protein GCM10007919_40760 [Rhizobium indigoferae]
MDDLDPNANNDLDPGKSPGPNPSREDIVVANFGIDGTGDLPPGERVDDLPEAFAIATTDFSIAKAKAFLEACLNSNPRVTYGLGKKISPGQQPGSGGFLQVDCSGFVRQTIRLATNLGGTFPDGSVVQHEWVRKKGYAPDSVASGAASDNNIRIAFLSPSSTSSGIGHVVLLYRGMSFESHGGVGPDSRPWTGAGWQAKTKVYVFGRAV